MAPRMYPSTEPDEIDLRELFRTLWASKITILLITLVCAVIAAAYAFLSTPIYQASVQTLPPTSGGLAAYNLGSQLTGKSINGIVAGEPAPGIDKLNTDAAYNAFLRRLGSDSVKLQFFNELYLPAYQSTVNGGHNEQLWRQLGDDLTIKHPSKPGEYAVTVSFQGTNSETIAIWANAYVDLAANATRKDLMDDLAGEVALRKQSVSNQINALRKVASTTRDDRIERVKNALALAESIDLQEPPAGSPLISVNNGPGKDTGALLDGNMMYLRGAKALRSELELLEKRENDDAYIAELPDLLKTQALLNSINPNLENLTVATVDRSATMPVAPIKPKKALILMLGIILGGILGIMVALIRKMFRA